MTQQRITRNPQTGRMHRRIILQDKMHLEHLMFGSKTFQEMANQKWALKNQNGGYNSTSDATELTEHGIAVVTGGRDPSQGSSVYGAWKKWNG
jgi:hypothetical protein